MVRFTAAAPGTVIRTLVPETPTLAQPVSDQVSAVACMHRLPATELTWLSVRVSGRPQTGTVAWPTAGAPSSAARALVNALPEVVAVPFGLNRPNQSSMFCELASAVTHE